MLILTRRIGEVIMIGDEVTITVIGVKGHAVRIGIEAPRDIAVHREEIYRRIKAEQKGKAGRIEESRDEDPEERPIIVPPLVKRRIA